MGDLLLSQSQQLRANIGTRNQNLFTGKRITQGISRILQRDHRQFFITRGFAHGFVVMTDEVVFQYKCDNFYAPQSVGAIAWDDPDLGIDWKVPADKIILSDKDKVHPRLKDAEWLFEYNDDLY